MSSFRRFLIAGSTAISLLLAASCVFALDAPTGKVVLTVSGAVTLPNASGTAEFDMAMLESLPQHSFTTETPWYSESKTFSGPLLRDVLAAAGAKGVLLRAAALNDYKTDIPAEDVYRYAVIVALLLDGKPMLTRDKGPLFIVYPFGSNADLRNALFYGRSAWQLRSIEVR